MGTWVECMFEHVFEHFQKLTRSVSNSRTDHLFEMFLDFWYIFVYRPRGTPWRPQRPVPAHRFWPSGGNLVLEQHRQDPKSYACLGSYIFVYSSILAGRLILPRVPRDLVVRLVCTLLYVFHDFDEKP